MLVLHCSDESQYGASIRTDAINTKEDQRTGKILVQRKAVLRYVSAYHTVSIEAVYVLARKPLIEIITDEYKMIYSTKYQISLGRGKALQVRFDERQVNPINGKNGFLET